LPGIGPKAAQQIILDLKGKLVVEATVKDISQNPDLLDAREGLKSFGFKVSEIDSALAKLNGQKLTVEEFIKQALKLLNTK
jgi:Holliday junction DNA helicase RuvA